MKLPLFNSFFILTMLFWGGNTFAGALRVNFLRPWDRLIGPACCRLVHGRYETDFFAEGGVKSAQGYNGAGNAVNVLKIFNCDQNALTFLQGVPENSSASELRALLDANDNGVRGHLDITGILDFDFAVAFGGRYFFNPWIALGVYLPVYQAHLYDICVQDLTKDITAADIRVQRLLTDTICQTTCELGQGLDLCNGWRRTGVGDLAVLFEFARDFLQTRPLLNNVRVRGRTGMLFPTALKSDPDILFGFAFGYDGATGILFGGGLDLTYMRYMRVGFDVELIHLFGTTREQRIQTSIDQTALLFPVKTNVYTDWALTQRFSVYAELFRVFGGLNILGGYQFFKHGRDEISFCSCNYSTNIANQSKKLDERKIHLALAQVNYDFQSNLRDDAFVWPMIGLYARIPFGGKFVAVAPFVGTYISLAF